MGRSLTTADLRKLADSLDAEERDERERELQAKVDRLEQQLANGGLSEEQRTTLERAQKLLDELEAADEREQNAGGNGSGDPNPPADPDNEPPAGKKKKMRPGRKSGEVYDWYTDDNGKVVRSDAGVVYTGKDEPDEVELPDGDGE